MKAKQKLACLIDFINQDIDSFSKGDLLKIFADISDLGMGYEFYIVSGTVHGKAFPTPADLPEAKINLKKLQNRLRAFLEKILATKNKRLGSKDSSFKLTFETPRKFILVDNGSLTLGFEGRGEYDVEFDFAQLIYDSFAKKDPWRSEGFISEDIFDAEVVAKLADIRQCHAPDCKNYFLRLYKKEKYYCSNKCAWRVYSNSRRAGSKKILSKRKRKGGK